MNTFGKNLILTALLLGAMGYCIHQGAHTEAALLGGIVVALWRRSGREGDGPALTLPAVSLAFLVFIACNVQHGGATYEIGARIITPGPAERVRAEYGAQAGLLVDLLEMRPVVAPACTAGRGCIYTDSTTGLIMTRDAASVGGGTDTLLKLHAAQSFRTSSNCAGLSSPANGDVCYDSALPAFRFYNAGWTTVTSDDSLVLHKAGSESVTGTKTWNANQTTTDASYQWGDATHRFTQVGTQSLLSGSTSLAMTSAVADGASAIGATFNNSTLANSTARLVSFQNNAIEKAAIRYDGAGIFPTLGPSVANQNTLPAVNGDTFVLLAATQSLSNKTLASPVLSGTLTGTYTVGGTPTLGSNLAAGSNKITGLANGTAATDAMAYGQLTAPGAIGGTTPAAGTFTALTATVSATFPASTLVYARTLGGGVGALTGTQYLMPPGVNASGTEYPLTAVTRISTGRNLYCYAGNAPGGADTLVLTVRKNASDQAVTCTITGAGQTCNDTSHTFTTAAGDRLSVKAVSSGMLASQLSCSFEETN